MPTLNKKLLANSLNIIYDLLQKSNNKALTGEISAGLNAAVYRSFRILYSANEKNPQGLFSIPEPLSDSRSAAAQDIAEANAVCLAAGMDVEELEGLKKGAAPALSPEQLSTDYPLFAASLFNLIQNAESRMGVKKEKKK